MVTAGTLELGVLFGVGSRKRLRAHRAWALWLALGLAGADVLGGGTYCGLQAPRAWALRLALGLAGADVVGGGTYCGLQAGTFRTPHAIVSRALGLRCLELGDRSASATPPAAVASIRRART
jgi:hypothetical protein